MSALAWHILLVTATVSGNAIADELLQEQKAAANAFLDALLRNDFESAGKRFDETLRKVLPPTKLESTWKSILAQLGPLQKRLGQRAETGAKYDIVYLTCQFEKKTLDVKVVFDKDKQLAGFFLSPSKPTEFAVPPYAKRESFREEDVVVGKGGDWPLPGTLTLPRGTGPFRVVVLVHGSGPHDRDETIGPNKPFRDLAWGLSTQGVAVLRYEKRTKEHGAKFAALPVFTLQEETIEDVRAAVALLRAHSDIDPRRIFVAGHSLGALAAPRIGAQEPALAGLILLAGNSRPLEDLIIDQFSYIYSLKGDLDDSSRAELDKIRKQVARAKDPKLTGDAPKAELPLGVPACYWLHLRAYDAPATAAQLRLPLLLLQGERDYQVTMDDFAGWKKALDARATARLKSYPTLNHLFMVGKGKAKPEEYDKAGHIAAEVVNDLANWVREH